MSTFNQAAEKYHTVRKVGKNDQTYLRYFNAFFGDQPINEITKEQILEAKIGIKGSAGTKNRYTSFLRAVLIFAYEELGWLDKKPVISNLKVEPRDHKFFTADQVAKLHDELPDHLKGPFIFSLLTGVRMSNCLNLEWKHIKGNKAWINASQSKSGRSISIPLCKKAQDLLAGLEKNHKYVFTYAGRKITRASNTGWYSALKRAGLEGYRWHDIRHTWASHHSMNGTSIQALKTLGGWSDIDIVDKNYSHLSDDYLTETCENIDPLVS